MNLIIVGFGYVSCYLHKRLSSLGNLHTIRATTRNLTPEKQSAHSGITLVNFNNLEELRTEIKHNCTHVLITAPPNNNGADSFLNFYEKSLQEAEKLSWVGYISTTSVYGDHRGKWVDEDSACEPTNQLARDRLAVEDQYRRLFHNHHVPVHVFRSSGIYGPGRSVFNRLKDPDFRPIRAPEHLFSRIHIEDLTNLLYSSMHTPTPGETFNLGDQQPASSYEVTLHACKLLGRTPPPVIDLNQAKLSPRMTEFYHDNKRVRAIKILKDLNVDLAYPTYKEGLEEIYRNS